MNSLMASTCPVIRSENFEANTKAPSAILFDRGQPSHGDLSQKLRSHLGVIQSKSLYDLLGLGKPRHQAIDLNQRRKLSGKALGQREDARLGREKLAPSFLPRTAEAAETLITLPAPLSSTGSPPGCKERSP